MKLYTFLNTLFFCLIQMIMLNAGSGIRDKMNTGGISEERRKDGCYTNLRENLFDEDADIENPDFVQEEAEEPEITPAVAPAPVPVAAPKPAPAPVQKPEPIPAPEPEEPTPAPSGMLGIETPTDTLDAALATTPSSSTDPEVAQALENPAIVNILNNEDDDSNKEEMLAGLLAAGLGAAGAGLLTKKLMDDRNAKKRAASIPKAPVMSEEKAKELNKTVKTSKQFTADDLKTQKGKLKSVSADQKSKPTTPVSLNDEIAKKSTAINTAGTDIEEKIAQKKTTKPAPKLTPLQEKMKEMKEKQKARTTSIDDDLAAAKAQKAKTAATPELTEMQKIAAKKAALNAQNPRFKQQEYTVKSKQAERDKFKDPATIEPKSHTTPRGPIQDDAPPVKPKRMAPALRR